MSEQEIPTAPEVEKPEEPESEPHPADAAAERFASLVAAILEPVKKSLEEHQAAELEHHRRVELKLKNILEQEQSFGRRLSELEGSVDRLTERVRRLEIADTEPPAMGADSSEPGGDS